MRDVGVLGKAQMFFVFFFSETSLPLVSLDVFH